MIALLACTACSGDPSGNGPGGTGNSGECGNEIGNGNQIIAGPAGPAAEDRDRPFRSLTVHPTNPDIVWVGTERNGMVRSSDGGRTWTRLRQGLRHLSSGYAEVWDLAVAAESPMVLIAATADSPGPLTGGHPSAIGGVYRSSDGGGTWQRANCGLPNGSITSAAFIRETAGAAIIGVSAGIATFSALSGQFFPGGLFRSTDGGRTWTAAATVPGIERSRFWQIETAAAMSTLFTFAFDYADATRSIGFLSSEDGGAHWIPLPDPLDGRFVADFAISSDGQTIYADTDDTFRMVRSRDGGASWTEVGAFANGTVAVSPADANLVLFEDFGTLRRSTDGLATWVTILTSPRRFEDIVFAPSDARIVYAVTEGYDVYRSDDAGASFSLRVNLRATVLR